MTATAIFPETDPVSFTITAHRQPCWTPGWITTNRIVFPRVGNPQPVFHQEYLCVSTERLDAAASREAILLDHLKDLGLHPYQISILSTPRDSLECAPYRDWLARILARYTARNRPVAFFIRKHAKRYRIGFDWGSVPSCPICGRTHLTPQP